MLVLSRTVGQSVLIGDDIEVIVHKLEGRTVKLAIQAPKEVTILRRELKPIDPPEEFSKTS